VMMGHDKKLQVFDAHDFICRRRQGVEGRENRLLTVAEVADYLRVEPESVRRWLRDGKLLGISLGRGPGWRIRLGDLELFITERHTRPGETPPAVTVLQGIREAVGRASPVTYVAGDPTAAARAARKAAIAIVVSYGCQVCLRAECGKFGNSMSTAERLRSGLRDVVLDHLLRLTSLKCLEDPPPPSTQRPRQPVIVRHPCLRSVVTRTMSTS